MRGTYTGGHNNGIKQTGHKIEQRMTPTQQTPVAKPVVRQEIKKSTVALPEADNAIKSVAPAGYERVVVPSMFLGAPFKEMFVRKLRLADGALIRKGVAEKNFTYIIDAIQNTCTEDIRCLTPDDYIFMLYWHRLNSLPRTPFRFQWNSFYNNSNTYTLSRSNLEVTTIALSQETYKDYEAQGFRLPTLRDHELLEHANLSPDQEYLAEQAQVLNLNKLAAGFDDATKAEYESLSDLQKLIFAVQNLDFEMSQSINKFVEVIKHGVVERVKVRDEKFKVEEAIQSLTSLESDIRLVIAAADAQADVQFFQEKRLEIVEELKRLNDAVANKISVEAKEEVIAINVNAMAFFP